MIPSFRILFMYFSQSLYFHMNFTIFIYCELARLHQSNSTVSVNEGETSWCLTLLYRDFLLMVNVISCENQPFLKRVNLLSPHFPSTTELPSAKPAPCMHQDTGAFMWKKVFGEMLSPQQSLFSACHQRSDITYSPHPMPFLSFFLLLACLRW